MTLPIVSAIAIATALAAVGVAFAAIHLLRIERARTIGLMEACMEVLSQTARIRAAEEARGKILERSYEHVRHIRGWDGVASASAIVNDAVSRAESAASAHITT